MSAVSIHSLHKHYPGVHALNNVDLTIPQGEFFGLLGPNGAGKTTLISVMAGLTRATSGEVSVMGFDVVKQYRQARQHLGVVPQEVVFDPFFTVGEMLRIQSGYFGLGRSNRAWIEELLETLHLTSKMNTRMRALSGGMKRRVLIAQALVHRPAVLVLDEPTAGVDVELRKILWQFTTKLHQEGHTIILTTHYLEEAEALCNQIAIINQGEVVALDSKQGLLARNPYRMLRVTVSEAPEKLPERLVPLLHEQKDTDFTFRLHRKDDPIADVLHALRHAGVEIMDLHIGEPTLESVFLTLTE